MKNIPVWSATAVRHMSMEDIEEAFLEAMEMLQARDAEISNLKRENSALRIRGVAA